MLKKLSRLPTKSYNTRIVVQIRRQDGTKQNYTVLSRSRNWLRTVLIDSGDRYQYYSQTIVQKGLDRLPGPLREFGSEKQYLQPTNEQKTD